MWSNTLQLIRPAYITCSIHAGKILYIALAQLQMCMVHVKVLTDIATIVPYTVFTLAQNSVLVRYGSFINCNVNGGRTAPCRTEPNPVGPVAGVGLVRCGTVRYGYFWQCKRL